MLFTVHYNGHTTCVSVAHPLKASVPLLISERNGISNKPEFLVQVRLVCTLKTKTMSLRLKQHAAVCLTEKACAKLETNFCSMPCIRGQQLSNVSCTGPDVCGVSVDEWSCAFILPYVRMRSKGYCM